MSPCLVQQLFRQKIGVELDPNVLDEVLFPLLRLKKHGPKELLQDIKLTSDILVTTEPWRPHTFTRAVLPFTEKTEYWDYMEQFPCHKSQVRAGRGRHTSKFRRKKIGRADWGTIDILNELRGLNYPQAGYKPRPYVIEEPDSFDDAYISLAEDNSLPATIRWGVDHSRQNAVLIDSRSQFVNNILDDVLLTDKRLNWSYERGHHLGGILSIEESSQHGSVQNQLY